MVVGVVLACSLCTKSMTVKQGLKDNNNRLAQSKFNLESSVNDNGQQVLEISGIGENGLGAGGVQAHGLDALASFSVGEDVFHDHNCIAKKNIAEKEKTLEKSKAFGKERRRKVLVFNGDVTYKKCTEAEEEGQAQEVSEECEEEKSQTTTQLGSLPPPLACVPVELCPPSRG